MLGVQVGHGKACQANEVMPLLPLHFTGDHRRHLQVGHLVHAHLDPSLFAKLLQLPLQFIVRGRHKVRKRQELELALLR